VLAPTIYINWVFRHRTTFYRPGFELSVGAGLSLAIVSADYWFYYDEGDINMYLNQFATVAASGASFRVGLYFRPWPSVAVGINGSLNAVSPAIIAGEDVALANRIVRTPTLDFNPSSVSVGFGVRYRLPI